MLVILNFALEPVAEHYANKALGNLKGYEGHLDDVDIHLWRGAYDIENLVIEKVQEDSTAPFFKTSLIELSVQWSALIHGKVVAEVILHKPDLNFVKVKDSIQSGGDNDYGQVLNDLLPVRINRFEVINGNVEYVDNYASPPVNIEAQQIHLVATNLSNVQSTSDTLPSKLSVSAHTTGNGELNINGSLNILKKTPDMDLKGEIRSAEITALNDLTESSASFNFEGGSLYLGSEFRMINGHFKGYLKPVMENIKVMDLDSKTDSFWRKAWEVVIGTTLEIFENQPHDRFATEIPFEGDVDKAGDISLWSTIINVLKNAFIDAFEKTIGPETSKGREMRNEEEDDKFLGIF